MRESFVFRWLFHPLTLSAIVLLSGVLMGVSLVSYRPGDPCLNVFVADEIQNRLGWWGASFADLANLAWGWKCFLLPIVFIQSAFSLMSYRSRAWCGLQMILFFMAFSLFPFAIWWAQMGGGLILFFACEGWGAARRSIAVIGPWVFQGITWIRGKTGEREDDEDSVLELTPLGHGVESREEPYSLDSECEEKENDIPLPDPTALLKDYGDVENGEQKAEKPLEKLQDFATGLVKRVTATPVDKDKNSRRVPRHTPQQALHARPSVRALPGLDLLKEPPPHGAVFDKKALEENRQRLAQVLKDFSIRGEIINIRPGPVVTLYELRPVAGLKSSRVIGLADDIARSMSAVSARVAVVPGKNLIGIELPNAQREMVFLRELLTSEGYQKTKALLPLALGKDIGGRPVIADLAAMPHLLVAGTTGSGKSVGMNTMILSLLYYFPADQCKFIMIDPKMLELSIYEGIPHLLAPVVTHPKQAVMVLKWLVREMENRYRAMAKVGVRNIAGYNQKMKSKAEGQTESPHHVQTRSPGMASPRRDSAHFDEKTGEIPPAPEKNLPAFLPFIVLVIDEMADLMLVAGKEIEAAVQRLAQMARAAGIHLITATQRPSVDVLTGTIKANFPTRMSFQVTSKIDSRTILGEQGAEQLLGQGDMLYMASGGRIKRLHGPFVSDDEVSEVVALLRQSGGENYAEDLVALAEKDNFDEEEEAETRSGSGSDDLYNQALEIVLTEKKASTSYIQRRLQIGYNRAARLIEKMEREGVISPANHVGKREILRH